ncbi:hypothetical protein AMTR_s00020p00021160 [Amborella trichopoda]|uniref:Uncharacterized protein n=1 Tax=Amborella trichopoda TaxID=13333 RepID=W1PVT0_AMBTC|nr:hypothetical protein AMTR_s00020p00021160 [Amborella trichopoda]
MLPFLLRGVIKWLIAFGVSGTYSLDWMVAGLASITRDTIDLEQLVYVDEIPSLEPLLRVFSDRPSDVSFVEEFLQNLQIDLDICVRSSFPVADSEASRLAWAIGAPCSYLIKPKR